MRSVLGKFLLITLTSSITLFFMLHSIEIEDTDNAINQSRLVVWDIINFEIFGIAFLVHTILPIFVYFLLIRIYLGHVYSLNRLISNKYCFYKNDDDSDNLD